ncbi:MAG TPA: hypothetical protein VFU73_09910 [Actinocrinis sp.]|nr:hypothetical protein [Actinocrinis sp.]
MALTALAPFEMPLLGRTKHKLAVTLDSKATAGEGTRNYLCAAQAAAVFVTLAITALWPSEWWLDPVVGLVIAGVSIWQGIESSRGQERGCRPRARARSCREGSGRAPTLSPNAVDLDQTPIRKRILTVRGD